VAIFIQRGKLHVFHQHGRTDRGPAAAAAVTRPCPCFLLPSARPLRRGEWGVAGGEDGPRRWGGWRRRRPAWLVARPQPNFAAERQEWGLRRANRAGMRCVVRQSGAPGRDHLHRCICMMCFFYISWDHLSEVARAKAVCCACALFNTRTGRNRTVQQLILFKNGMFGHLGAPTWKWDPCVAFHHTKVLVDRARSLCSTGRFAAEEEHMSYWSTSGSVRRHRGLLKTSF